MRRFVRSAGTAGIVAIAAVVVSATLAAGAGYRALRLEPAPVATAGGGAMALEHNGAAYAERVDVSAVVQVNPFSPDRRAPSRRYRLSGEEVAEAAPPSRAPALRLIGTVVGSGEGEESFVMCQMGREPPRIVRMGEQIGDYTLRSVGRGTAVFTSASGDRIELQAFNPGS